MPRLVERLRQIPQLADVASDLQDQGLQAYVDIDRRHASRLGITPAAVDNALYNAFGQRLVSTIFTQSNQYRVVLEVQPDFQKGPAALDDIYVGPPRLPGIDSTGNQTRAANPTANLPVTRRQATRAGTAIVYATERPGHW